MANQAQLQADLAVDQVCFVFSQISRALAPDEDDANDEGQADE